MAVDSTGSELVSAVALLGAAVVAVPIFKRIGLGSIVGYLIAGIAIGPFGLKLFREPGAILGVAEFGVVLLLFVIGLELKPSRLWALRADIFGLGAAQVIVCGALLTGAGWIAGLDPAVAFVAASGMALSSTAIVMQILEERGEATETYGQKTFAVLLLQDLAIVPLLAALAVIAPYHVDGGPSRLVQIAIAAAAIAGLVAVGRYLLNPLFQVLAASQAREIMAAAALLVVLGAALAMQASGLSMAMGAFIAGVLLSESSFRHQLEADIEPFRGLLLGLFFLAVGMSIDLALIAHNWLWVLAAVAIFTAVKVAGIYGVARLFRNGHGDSLRLALMLAQGGEFAFVLFTTAQGLGLIDTGTSALLTAAVIVSMALTPLAPILLHALLPEKPAPLDGIATLPDGLTGSALVIGFGRFGQVVSQALLARGIDVTIIDSDTEMIRSRQRFRLQDLLRRRHTPRRAARGRRRQRQDRRDLHRQAGRRRPHRRGGQGRLPARQRAGTLLRSRPHPRSHRRRRRLSDPRDLRIGDGLWRGGVARPRCARRGRGRGARRGAQARRGAAGAADGRRHHGGPRPDEAQRADADAAHPAQAQGPAAERGDGGGRGRREKKSSGRAANRSQGFRGICGAKYGPAAGLLFRLPPERIRHIRAFHKIQAPASKACRRKRLSLVALCPPLPRPS